MNIVTVSATHARNNFFELLNLVANGQEVVVKRDNKKIARVVPEMKTAKKHLGMFKALKEAARGFKYDMNDNPLRRPGATDFLGKWDINK